jgi:hypothetical protein
VLIERKKFTEESHVAHSYFNSVSKKEEGSGYADVIKPKDIRLPEPKEHRENNENTEPLPPPRPQNSPSANRQNRPSSARLPVLNWDMSKPFFQLSEVDQSNFRDLLEKAKDALHGYAAYLRYIQQSLHQEKKPEDHVWMKSYLSWKQDKDNYKDTVVKFKEYQEYAERKEPSTEELLSMRKEKHHLKKEMLSLKQLYKSTNDTSFLEELHVLHSKYTTLKQLLHEE